MAPQSLDLGLSLGLGVVAFQLQPSFCHPAGNAAEQREASPTAAEERERRCSPAGSPASSGSGSGKRAAAERSAGAGSGSGDEDDEGGARKKLRLSKDQAAVLEECFKTHHTLTPRQKAALASRLGLRARQVEVWFQNRRARTKLKQTEVDCEYLKRWCEQLAEKNRRLGKEVAELRALSATPSPAPAAPLTAVTMCPSCRRVASSSPSPNTHAHAHAHAAAACSDGNMVIPAAAVATLPAHQQFLCGFRDAGAAAAAVHGTSDALAKAVTAAR